MTRILQNIKILSYRQLRHIELSSLGDVNLIVGGNNSGKTTFLEAVRLFAAKGSPSLLEELLNLHGEFQVQPEGDLTEGRVDRSIANLFYNRKFSESDGDGIYIGLIDGKSSVALEHVYLREMEEEREVDGGVELVHRLKKVSKSEYVDNSDVVEALEIRSAGDVGLFGPNIRTSSIPLGMLFGDGRRLPRARFDELHSAIPVSFVPFRSNGREGLAEAWDDVVLTDGEETVLASLRLIEPRVQGLAFVQGSRGKVSRLRSEERQAVLKVEGSATPISLQSMGDGMTRVLQLVLSALKAKNGFLLIDELENGLHYSVQEQVWGLLFKLASKNNIQIFVTTHSLDCVRAFSRVADADGQAGVLIKMSRCVDSWDTEAVLIAESGLANLVHADIEVR